MQFLNRAEAGQRLVNEIKPLLKEGESAIVVALPRGGVAVGQTLAKGLVLPLDIVVVRKVGSPQNSEYAIGALAEGNQAVWNEAERLSANQDALSRTVGREMSEAKRRLKDYRAGLPKRDWQGKTVVLTDDGAATGFSLLAALKAVRTMKAGRIIVALPVAPPGIREIIEPECDEYVVLSEPIGFVAVGSHYREFDQLNDAAVKGILGSEQG